MNVRAQFKLLSWKCLNCGESNDPLKELSIEYLKEGCFAQAENDHYDQTYKHCTKKRLQMTIVRVYTEEQ